MTQALKSHAVSKLDLEAFCKQLIITQDPVEFECNGHSFVLITKQVYDYFEALELEEDARAAKETLDEMKATGEKPIPWEDIKEKYGFQE